MEIFHISAECYPVAKVGGLADVVGVYQSIKISQVILQELLFLVMM
jgi:starch synthase